MGLSKRLYELISAQFGGGGATLYTEFGRRVIVSSLTKESLNVGQMKIFPAVCGGRVPKDTGCRGSEDKTRPAAASSSRRRTSLLYLAVNGPSQVQSVQRYCLARRGAEERTATERERDVDGGLTGGIVFLQCSIQARGFPLLMSYSLNKDDT